MQFGFVLAAALAASIPAASASASSFTYTYQGQPFGYLDPVTDQWAPCGSHPPSAYECDAVPGGLGWTGSVTLSDQYPGGRIAGSTLTMQIFDMSFFLQTGRGDEMPCTVYGITCSVFTVETSSGQRFTGYESGNRGSFPFAQYSGDIGLFIGGTIDYGWLSLQFGRRGQIISWSGFNFLGGDDDPWTGSYDRVRVGAYTQGPGTWTGSAGPSPVPLPASLSMAASAIAALAIAGRKLRQIGRSARGLYGWPVDGVHGLSPRLRREA